MKAMLVFNPASRGAARKGVLQQIEKRLAENGIRVETCIAREPGSARRLASGAASTGRRMVIAAGGDGTIHEVINGIAGMRIALGIVPMGTGNVLAWEMGIPIHPLRACDTLSAGEARTIDLGRLSDGSYFSCMAGVGVDAQVVQELDPSMKGLLGVAAYPISGLRTVLHYGLPELSVEIDGGEPPLIGYAVAVCNARHYGGKFILCPKARIDDGWLDICILQKRDTATILKYGLRVLISGPPEGMKGIAFRRGKSVRVTSVQRVPVQSDGDIIGTTPVSFSIVPGALRVIAPPPATQRWGRR